MLKKLEEAGWLDAHEAVAQHGNNYLPPPEKYYKSHRSALSALLDAVEFEPTSANRLVLDAVEFVRAFHNRTSEHIPTKITAESTDE